MTAIVRRSLPYKGCSIMRVAVLLILTCISDAWVAPKSRQFRPGDAAASRVDSTQEIAKGLLIPCRHAIFGNDKYGNIQRIQYNEVFCMPLALPSDLFQAWFAAFSKFVTLIHDNKVAVPMKEGTILLMNNWRVLHGRAGKRASPDRHVVGGTIVWEVHLLTCRSIGTSIAQE